MRSWVSDLEPIRQFPGIFLMRPGVSDPEPIRKFPRNFLLRSRKQFKLFFWAGQPASRRSGPRPGPMDQGRTRAQWARAMGPGQGP